MLCSKGILRHNVVDACYREPTVSVFIRVLNAAQSSALRASVHSEAQSFPTGVKLKPLWMVTEPEEVKILPPDLQPQQFKDLDPQLLPYMTVC